jgi:hypothetical protein
MRDLDRLRQTFYIGPSNFSVFIQIRFLSLPFYIGALQRFCIYKRPSELLFFYNLVLIFISHNITRGYQLVSFAIVPWYFRWLVLHDMHYFRSIYFNTSSYLSSLTLFLSDHQLQSRTIIFTFSSIFWFRIYWTAPLADPISAKLLLCYSISIIVHSAFTFLHLKNQCPPSSTSVPHMTLLLLTWLHVRHGIWIIIWLDFH